MKKTYKSICTILLCGLSITATMAQLRTPTDSVTSKSANPVGSWWINKVNPFNVGATASINASSLESYPDMVLSNSLQGKLAGLGVVMNAGGPGNNIPSLYIRGLHRETGNQIITIVDGVERDINMLNPEEIATVEILKDPSTKIFYGPRAANGVLVVTTKHGQSSKMQIRAHAGYGLGLARRMPDYLNSYNYAQLYNEARANDGLSALYTENDLNGYRQSKGANDFRYPNVDFQDLILRQNTQYRKAGLEITGGKETSKYAFVVGYNGITGLEKVGETPQRNRFNFRSNLDIKVNRYIGATIGMAGVFDTNERGSLSYSETFSELSTHRPNEYPIYLPDNLVQPDSSGMPAMGVGLTKTNNLYGSLRYGGYQKDQSVNGQLNFGLDFDLRQVLKGLTAKTYVTFDNYFSGTEVLTSTPNLYSQRWVQTPDGRDSVILTLRTKGVRGSKLSLQNSKTYRTSSMNMALHYQNAFAGHNKLSADYQFSYFLSEATGENQDLKFVYNVGRLNWVNREKYIANLDLGMSGSNKFQGSNQFSPSFAGGVAWIASQEDFFRNIPTVNYLKLKGSAGILSYDGQTDYNLYRDRWNDSQSSSFNNGLKPPLTTLVTVGNPDLKWEKSAELNLGFETMLWNRRLWVEANYFTELRKDIITKVQSLYPAEFGDYYSAINYGKVRNSGFDVDLTYADQVGKLHYQVGANVVYSVNKVLKTDENNGIYSNLNKTNHSSDAIFGYVSSGLFGKDVPLNGHPTQSLGGYQNGDIAYRDLNKDGVVNEFDQQIIGNSFPRTQLGIDFTLSYKGFGLYVEGTSQLGFDILQNNSYYWVKGEDKYSTIAATRYHATLNPTGSYPRLTTGSGANNYTSSTFWLENGDFFRLKNVELSYTLISPCDDVMKKIKFFVRGNNLWLLAYEKNLDPEVMSAGVTNYPVLTTLTGGCNITF